MASAASSLPHGARGTTREILEIGRRHWRLALEMTRREITDRYSGQMLGAAWAVVHPVLLIGIYVLVFVVVFKVRIGGTREMPLDYTTYLLVGLMPWLGLQEAMTKGATAVTANKSLVKQVVFPLEILPLKTTLASLVSVVVSLVVVVGYILAKFGALPWTALLVPVLLVLEGVWACGVALLLAAVGVFLRDTKDLVQVGTLICMYTLPIFYLPTFLPGALRPVLYLNPFSYLIWCYQDALFYGRFEHPVAWLVMPVLSIAFFLVGFRVFRWSKVMFGNAL